MAPHRSLLLAAFVLSSATAGAAEPTVLQAAPAARTPAQGIAVVAVGGARADAASLARSVYATTLRPRTLDEAHARVLAGYPAPPSAPKDVTELAELRAAIKGDDAASRELLATVARRTGVEGLLVVSASPAPAGDAGAPPATEASAADAGAAASTEASAADAGAVVAPAPVDVRLFVTETGDLEPPRYTPDASGWHSTVASLARRFPAPALAVEQRQPLPSPATMPPSKSDKPFYASPWVWGALGAAALLGGAFFIVSQDTSSDPIHLQMRVPR